MKRILDKVVKKRDGRVSFLKIALLIVATPILIVVLFVIAAFMYVPFQKPVYVNEALAFQNPLRIPALIEPTMDAAGEKVFDLNVQNSTMEFFKDVRTQTLGFNGGYLGPTIRIHAGDKVRMKVTNDLAEAATVHWHGMELPAKMDGGPHQIIEPGATWQPYWTVTNQASTLWYHSHLVEQTGEQVYKGLAGMVIVDDQNSDSLSLPKTYGVDDIPLIVQDRKFDKDGQLLYQSDASDAIGHTGMLGDKILVDGTYAPYAKVPAGRVRLRVLNASNARRFNFAFADGRAFYQIASDGGLLESPVTRTSIELGPAERAEIVVDLSRDTKPITLLSKPIYEPIAPLRFARALFGANRDGNQEFKIIELRPEGSSTATSSASLPQKLNTIPKLTANMAVKTRTFTLDRDEHSINGKKMDPARVDQIVVAGSTEIWQVQNESGSYHPFHIHGVQFQILNRNGKAPEPYEQGWKDTVDVGVGEGVRLIMRFPDYPDPHAAYMFHCHILEHEDMGMMGQYVLVGKDTPARDIHVDELPGISGMPDMKM